MNKAFIISFLVLVCAFGGAAQAVGKNLPLEIKFGREALGKVPTVEVLVNGKKRFISIRAAAFRQFRPRWQRKSAASRSAR
jgi:hypothetical protein